MNEQSNNTPEQQELQDLQEGIKAFHALPRKEKLAALKEAIKSTQTAIESAVNLQQRMELYSDLGQLLMNLQTLKMNKYDSPHFQFIPNPSGTNRAERRRRK